MTARDDVIKELTFLYQQANPFYRPEDLNFELSRLTYLIDKYNTEHPYLPDSLQLNNQAVYNLYHWWWSHTGYSAYWSATFEHVDEGFNGIDLSVKVTAKHFYSCNQPITYEVETYRGDAENNQKVSLACYQLYRLCKHDLSYDEFEGICLLAGFTVNTSTKRSVEVCISCSANHLATWFCKMVNLTRYLAERSYNKEPITEYLKQSHVATPNVYLKEVYHEDLY